MVSKIDKDSKVTYQVSCTFLELIAFKKDDSCHVLLVSLALVVYIATNAILLSCQ